MVEFAGAILSIFSIPQETAAKDSMSGMMYYPE